MLIINNKFEAKTNEYEISENVAYVKLSKKDGTIINAKIDAEDLDRVSAKGIWFAEWNKNFNSYLVQTRSGFSKANKNHAEKQSLHSFILSADPKAPIRHKNGDTLDNRKCNLEIYNQNAVINDYKILDIDTIAIILRDKYGNEAAKTIIHKEDLDKVINKGYTWVYHKNNMKPYAVANSPGGRIYLNRYIMDTPEHMTTHHINLNTLDNRRCNLENISIEEDDQTE